MSIEMTGGPSVLTRREREHFAICEQEIEYAESASFRRAKPLRDIKDAKLFRETYASWKDYTRDRWGHAYTTIDRDIRALNVVEELEALGLPAPCTEAQARPLVPLSTVERVQVALAVRELGGFRDLSKRGVEDVVVAVTGRDKPEASVPAKRPGAALLLVTNAGRVGESKHAKKAMLKHLAEMRKHADAIQRYGPHAIPDLLGALSEVEAHAAKEEAEAIMRVLVRFADGWATTWRGIDPPGQQSWFLAA
jgi:hypothetical protein